MTVSAFPMLLDPLRLRGVPLSDLAVMTRGGAQRCKVLAAQVDTPDTLDALGDPLYDVVRGVAIVRIYGALFDDDVILARLGWSGYGGLAVQIAAATADESVRGVFLDIDSPGGVGAPALAELAEQIAAANKVKPVVANIKGMAASAAYWLAAAAGAVMVPVLGEVGSIGVWTMHVDMSARLEEMGLKVTIIFAGAHKVDGQPFAPLSDDARTEMQADIDDFRKTFADAVARYRGISVENVLATEARLYRDSAAVAEGLADAVVSREASLQALIDHVA